MILDEAPPQPLHLLFLDPGDVDEETAALRLAAAALGPGVEAGRPVEAQITCRAAARGLLSVDTAALQRVNRFPDVTIFTLPDGMPVEPGRALAGIKVTPLAVSCSLLGEVEASLASGGPLLQLLEFRPARISVLVCETLPASRRQRFEADLQAKLAWFGSELVELAYLPDRGTAGPALMDRLARASDLLLIAGVASIDPLDPPWQALLAAGASTIRRGLPVHPGSSYWVAELHECIVIGVASCGMFSRRTALDLLLARRLSGQPLDADYLSGMGHGGLLARELAFRFPIYPEWSETSQEEAL